MDSTYKRNSYYSQEETLCDVNSRVYYLKFTVQNIPEMYFFMITLKIFLFFLKLNNFRELRIIVSFSQWNLSVVSFHLLSHAKKQM